MKRFVFVFIVLLGVVRVSVAQVAPAFWSDIIAFRKQDSARAKMANPILFIGSSSFTNWKDVQAYFPGYPILNRGFGGSTLPDVIRYAYDIIIPYQPKQVVIYCGENDLASADSVSVAEVVRRAKTLFQIIRVNLPDANICYVSMKPSPVRAIIQSKVRAANAEIKKFYGSQKNAGFIDIYDAMLDRQGRMREELYLEDRLHMKPEGYAIWQSIMQPFLKK
jgi:lysophospholipase L1-like esterase